jgi:hypothetical protein
VTAWVKVMILSRRRARIIAPDAPAAWHTPPAAFLLMRVKAPTPPVCEKKP